MIYQYLEMYKRSIEDPAGFWSDIASEFYWKQRWGDKVYDENFDVRKGKIKFEVIHLFPLSRLDLASSGCVFHRLSGCIFCFFVHLLHCCSGSRVASPTSVIIA